MEKGKAKKEEKYISLLLVPHSTSKVKTIRFSALYSKLLVLFIAVALVLICSVVFVISIVSENHTLKSTVTELSSQHAEQQNLLKEKSGEIKSLMKKQEENSKKIKECLDKYKELTNSYISRSVNISVSRSGGRSSRAFVNDLNKYKSILNSLSKSTKLRSSSLKDLKTSDEKLDKYIDSIPTQWPVSGNISSRFGGRTDPFAWSKRFHKGIDIAARYGSRIVSSASGRVTFSGWTGVYGKTLIISHGHGVTTFYGHSSRLLVNVGDEVKKGECIALVGSTGRSTGSHLHFEVRVNGSATNPLKYLN